MQKYNFYFLNLQDMKRLLPVLAYCLFLASCSTTRVLNEGEYRLTGNRVLITDDPEFRESEIRNYIRQDSQSGGFLGFNPFLYVYNWSRRDGLWHKLGTPPVVFDEAAVSTSVTNISNHLKYLGYYDAAVGSMVNYYGKKVKVDYTVTLGKRYPIEKVVFEVPEYAPFSDDFYADSTTALEALRGRFLSEQMLEQETVRSASRMRDLGYYSLTRNNYSFEADTLGGSAILRYRVREYERNQTENSARPLNKYKIGKVAISLPKGLVFRESLLKKLNQVKPGQVYSESAVTGTYNRLSAIKAFSSVGIEMSEADSSTVDCNINISRSGTQGFKVNLEASTNSSGLIGISPRLSYFHKNIFHGGEWLNLGFNGDFQFRPGDNTQAKEFGVSAGISIPRILGFSKGALTRTLNPRTEFNMAFNHQNRPEYTRNIMSMTYGYAGVMDWHDITYQVYPLQLNFVKLYDLDAGFSATLAKNPYMRYSYQDHLDAGVGKLLYYNSSREIVPSGSYHFHRLSVDVSGNILSMFTSYMGKNSDGSYCIGGSPFAQYIRGEYSFGNTWRSDSNENLAVATRFLIGAGYAYGNSSALPFEKQFYAGGASSMRGWQARALGPGSSAMDNTFVIPSQTGDFKLEMNIEYRFRMFWKFEGALFADVGNVWNLRTDLPDFYKSLGADWGAGLRVNLEFILFRIDFGMKLVDPSLREGARLIGPDDWFSRGNNAIHFGIGYPF